MTQIIQFTPRKELSARRNLQNLIILAKDHLTLWANLPGFTWKDSIWPTTHHGVRFTNHENRLLHPSKKPEPDQLMHPDFSDFAKAYLRYRHTISPHRNIPREMQALRVMEMVLRQDMAIPEITKFNQRHFDQAITEISVFSGAQNIATELLNILKTLADFFIVTHRTHYWKHPYVGTASYDFKNGAHADFDTKEAKLPDQDSLLAIAEIFAKGYEERLEDSDTMITSTTCLFLCAPMRINETLRLRVNCLDDDLDKYGNSQSYLKYWVPKISLFNRKPIPTTMATHAIEAVKRLKNITNEGRKLALYMEGNPTKFYRHENCPDVPDDQLLTRDQVAQALGYANAQTCQDFVRRSTGTGSLIGFTLDSLWQVVLEEHRRQNPHFPYQEPATDLVKLPLKMSESLYCFRRNQFGIKIGASPVLLTPFNSDYFVKRLDASIKSGRKSQRPLCFFSRHGYRATKLKSHSLRHFLNRLARRSGVSIETITAWSSRASCKQTRTYLNDDPKEAASKVATLMGMHEEQKPKTPITEAEAELLGQGPIHRSRYGLCRRSWRSGPCNRFADCLNCSELLMCKGDKLAAETVAADREHLINTYRAAMAAIERGERSASRWVQGAALQIERLTQLLEILNNSDIPDGSPIEIAGTDFSHEQVLVEEKAAAAGVKLLNRGDLTIEYGSELIACLDLLRTPEYA
ncbi:integrase [Pseudomonas sp. BN102]|uniref:integrase n=1 Tax=Pseudomonas sp. BN102 TaxID=2567886 RepID=UPI0024584D13|nr:integrase [Pseudomonas sp. BN102]MDH4610427.1 integrase [Pseudomonas sp. BN102]